MCYLYYKKENDMETVTVSPKYQVVIPRSIRERIRIRPGERLQVICFDDRIELIPIRPMHEVKGFLKGLDARFERDEEDRV
jgi:AbrB family looped-hinge helix DNA binding protein